MPIFPFKKEPSSAKATEGKEKDEEKGFLEAIKETEKIEEKPGEVIPEALPAEIKKEEEEKKEIEKKPEERGEQPVTTPPQAPTIPTQIETMAPPKIKKSTTLLEIEQILSENLDELYTSLSAEQKLIFKQKGEETAFKIEILFKQVKINFQKILTLIKDWLLMLAQLIPGVNKIFLIQEAKIKTNKILLLKEKEKNKK